MATIIMSAWILSIRRWISPAIAKSLGLEAIEVTDPGELKSALSSAFGRPGTKLIEVVVSNAVN